MARLLVHANGERKGQIVVGVPNEWVFGAMEDKDQYRAKYGDSDGWPDTFVIVDLPDMSIEEAEELAAPVMTYKDGAIDPLDGLPKQILTIHYNSKGLVDFEAMADTSAKLTELSDDRKVSRNVEEVRQYITERKSG